MAPVTRGSCPLCPREDILLYNYEPTDPSLGLACPECVRARAKTITRTTACDVCGSPGAWRNPFTRRNEYLCGNHHASSGDGIVLNKWLPRASEPHPEGRRLKCVVADNSCRGEVKLTQPTGELLCRKHAGKVSAAWHLEDSDTYRKFDPRERSWEIAVQPDP
jgi:hypothetical protein